MGLKILTTVGSTPTPGTNLGGNMKKDKQKAPAVPLVPPGSAVAKKVKQKQKK